MLNYIAPIADGSLSDAALAAVLQSMVVGLTGLDPTLVRPRWQTLPPTMPVSGTDWCAIGVTSYQSFDYPQWSQDADTYGTLHRHERFDVLATFYGPGSAGKASRLRDGLYINLNYSLLAALGVKLRAAEDITHTGEEVNAEILQRSDLHLSFTRMVERSYAVPAIATVTVDFITDTGLTCSITATNT